MASINEVSFFNRFESFFNNVGDFFSFGPNGASSKNVKSPQVKERGGNNFSLGDVATVADSSAGRTATGWASQLLGGRKKDSSATTSNAACPGTLPIVADQCGCNPLYEAVYNFSSIYPMDKTMMTAVTQCVSGTANINIASYDIVRGNLEGCVNRVVQLDIPQRDTILDLLAVYVQEAGSRLEQWNICQQSALGVVAMPLVAPQVGNDVLGRSTLPSSSLSTSPLTIPQVQPVVQQTIPVFDHAVRLKLSDVSGHPFDFHRVYPGGKEVHYQITITPQSSYATNRQYIVEIRWPGVNDYFDSRKFEYTHVPVHEGCVISYEFRRITVYGQSDLPEGSVWELPDATLTMELLEDGTKTLLIIPKPYSQRSSVKTTTPQSLIDYSHQQATARY